jgi:hypothetical protein
MARKQSEAAIRAAKEAKQKKLLILLIVPFIALLAWQGPKTYKALMGGSPPPESTPLPLPATTAPAGTSPLPGQPTQAGELPDTDPQPTLLDGQLLSFSRFSGRDPFINRVPDDGSASATAGATIEVNGESEDVGINDPFPASDPTFKLVSITDTAANIGLVSGSFSNGSDTITIAVGETLVLAADDGTRYAIKIVSVAT